MRINCNYLTKDKNFSAVIKCATLQESLLKALKSKRRASSRKRQAVYLGYLQDTKSECTFKFWTPSTLPDSLSPCPEHKKQKLSEFRNGKIFCALCWVNSYSFQLWALSSEMLVLTLTLLVSTFIISVAFL
jgi:hypothetical protein